MKKRALVLGVVGAVLLLSFGLLYSLTVNQTPSIQITSPVGGDFVEGGSVQTIQWLTQHIPSTHKISVTLRRIPPPALQTEGQEFDPIVFTDLPNTGSVDWVVAGSYPSGKYVLGVTSYASVPVTDPVMAESGEFTIVNTSQIVGGDRDEHGCIGSAGYSWCDASASCIRPWETYCTAAPAKTVTFTCDAGKSIVATFYPTDDKFVDLKLSDGRNMSVPRAISASGARYATSDESFVFWNKGDTAFITEGGAAGEETYSNCALLKG